MGTLESSLDTNKKRTLLYYSAFVCMGLAVGVIGPVLPKLREAAGNSGSGERKQGGPFSYLV